MVRGDLTPVTAWRIPKGRTAAEKRLAAIAALHQPMVLDHGAVRGMDLGRELICPACSGRHENARWPCATARLLGPWPGEVPDLDGG